MTTRLWTRLVLLLGMTIYVGWRAVAQFGWGDGMAVVFAVYLLMPWAPQERR